MAKTPADVKSLARAHTASAIKTLAAIMNKTDAVPSARVAAASVLLDRGWGKPEQHVTSETAISYVARMPAPAENTDEWHKQHAPSNSLQ